MNDSDNSYPYQPFTPAYKPEAPEMNRKDILTCLSVFGAVFVFSLYSLPFSIEFLFNASFGGYIKFLCICVIFTISLLYVKKQKGASMLSTVFFALCSSCLILPYILNGGSFYCVPAFLYLVGAMCVTKTGSLTQKRESYRYLFEELKDIYGYPLKYCLLPIKGILRKIRFKNNKKLNGALLGCIFATPVVAVLIGLLSSGDAAFNNITSKITDFLAGIFDKLSADNIEFLFTLADSTASTLVFGTVVFSALFCFRYGIQKKVKENSPKEESINTSVIPENIASGFFVLICLLYVFYLFSQLSYFFGAFSGKIPLAVNMSLSEYARRGFFEMSAISFINLGLIALGMIFVKRRESGKIAPLFKGVFTFLCLFTELLIITAMSKMALYITEMGLTHKRILVCIIDILLFATVLCVLIKLYKASFPYMKIIVSLCCAVLSLYSLIGDGVLIASFNTNAYLKGYHTDYDIHTVRLESDDYHALKSLHTVAQADKEKSFDAKHWIGVLLNNNTGYDNEIFEKKLKESTVKGFFGSDYLADFLFWEYVKENKDFMEKCLDIYNKQEEDNYNDGYYDYEYIDEYSYLEGSEE